LVPIRVTVLCICLCKLKLLMSTLLEGPWASTRWLWFEERTRQRAPLYTPAAGEWSGTYSFAAAEAAPLTCCRPAEAMARRSDATSQLRRRIDRCRCQAGLREPRTVTRTDRAASAQTPPSERTEFIFLTELIKTLASLNRTRWPRTCTRR
jgi:hypothetical protein